MHIGIDSIFDALGESFVPFKGGEEVLGVSRFKGGKNVVLACGKDAEVVVWNVIHRGSIYPRSYAHWGW